MEQQSIIETFKIFLDRTHYIGTIVPLNLFIRNCSLGSYRDFLEQCEALWNDKELIKNWKGDANEKYYRLWYLGIAQLVHCHLNQGKLCKDVALLSAYFELLFKNVSFDLPKLPKSLPVLALRDYEKKHLEQRDFSQLVLDIDMAPHPENKLKYVCNYLFNDNDMETLAELLDFYGEKYAPPIEASVLINYWTAKRLCGIDNGCFWKVLRHLIERTDGRELFGQEQLALLNGDEFIQAMAAEVTADYPKIPDGGQISVDGLTAPCLFLKMFAPLAEAVCVHYRDIPENEWNYYDERLCTLASQSVALGKSNI